MLAGETGRLMHIQDEWSNWACANEQSIKDGTAPVNWGSLKEIDMIIRIELLSPIEQV
jgi:hypothetical protein